MRTAFAAAAFLPACSLNAPLAIDTSVAASSADCAPDVSCLSLGWDDKARTFWYETSQGSRLIPEPWTRALTAAKSDKLFWGREHFSKYGYIWNKADAPFPIGFVRDEDKERQFDWIGLNCAACHTSQIENGGTKFRIDGGQALADFRSMNKELIEAVEETYNDPVKWAAFSSAVLGASAAAGNDELRADVKEWVNFNRPLSDRNETPVIYGYGRLDAVGHIFNKVAHVLSPDQAAIPSDGPTSYPFVWNASQQKKLQWNGIVDKSVVLFKKSSPRNQIDISGLGRNVGEVIGVFADMKVEKARGTRIKKTSVRVKNLIDLETTLATLQSPKWPDALGPIDTKGAARGEHLFKEYKCQECHAPLASDAFDKEAVIMMEGIFGAKAGTDPWMTCNAIFHKSDSGPLQGGNTKFLSGPSLKEREATITLLNSMVVRTVIKEKGPSFQVFARDLWRSIVEIFIPRTEMEMVVLSESDRKPLDLLYDKKQIDLKKCKQIALGTDEAQKDKRELLKYKARPLNGAWATAPFLHNGSVPNLRYLLARPENRPKSFYVGSRRFDGDGVGFATDHQPGETTSLFEVEFLSDNGSQKVIPGNDNAGHTHGAGLCAGTAKPFAEESGDCKAMLLYLKSL